MVPSSLAIARTNWPISLRHCKEVTLSRPLPPPSTPRGVCRPDIDRCKDNPVCWPGVPTCHHPLSCPIAMLGGSRIDLRKGMGYLLPIVADRSGLVFRTRCCCGERGARGAGHGAQTVAVGGVLLLEVDNLPPQRLQILHTPREKGETDQKHARRQCRFEQRARPE